MLKFSFSIIYLFVFFLSSKVHAISLTSGRGEVSLIRKNDAKNIDTSDISSPIKIIANSLIVTGENTYARLINERGDIIILGPQSKMTYEAGDLREGDLLSLHSGMVRIVASKQRKVAKDHFDRVFLRTNSAVVGVEKGDILLTYNVFNNVTGLIGFRGTAFIKRVDKSSDLSALQRLVFRRSLKGRDLKFQFRDDDSFIKQAASVNNMLFDKGARGVSVVERGQYSATFHDARPASIPVKINPIQFTLLYRNTYLDMTSYTEGNSGSSTVKAYPIKGDILAPKEQLVSYRGQYSRAQKKYAPKAGGLVDIRTGIYIPPEEDAVFNEVYKVYVPKKIGRINAVNGNFVAPQNLKVDPNRGFVVVNNTHESLAQEGFLNNLLKSNLLLASYKSVQSRKMTTAELYSANIVGLSYINQGYDGKYGGTSYDLTKSGIELSLVLIGNGSFRPFAKFRLLNGSYEHAALSNSVERFYQMNLGVDYQFASAFYVSGQLSIDEEPIIVSSTSTITSAVLSNLVAEAGVKILNSKSADLFLRGGLKYNMSNEDDLFDIQAGFGYYIGASGKYWANRRSYFSMNLDYLMHSFDITGNGNDSSVDMSGLSIKAGYQYCF